MVVPEKLLRQYKQEFPGFYKFAKNLLKKPDWSKEYYFPFIEVFDYFRYYSKKTDKDTVHVSFLNACLLNWEAGKGIYKFDDTLLENLFDTDLDQTISIDVIEKLPEFCCYIDISHFSEITEGFFVMLTEDFKESTKTIMFCIVEKSIKTQIIAISLINKSLKKCVSHTIKSLSKDCMDDDYDQKSLTNYLAETIPPLISTVLYLCTTNAEIVNTKNPNKKPRKIRFTKNYKPISKKPVEYRVGAKLGSQLRQAIKTHSTGTGSAKIPHLRRAHFHSYWTGKKPNQQLITKWLSPILVNKTMKPIVPVVHKVEKI